MVTAMQFFIKQLKYNSEFKIKNRDVIFRVKIVTSENRCIPYNKYKHPSPFVCHLVTLKL